MVDCLTISNSTCIACIWCFLVSVFFPKFTSNFDKKDSSELSTFQKERAKKCPEKTSNLDKERSSSDENSDDSVRLKNSRKLQEEPFKRSIRKKRFFGNENIRPSKYKTEYTEKVVIHDIYCPKQDFDSHNGKNINTKILPEE